MKHLVFNAAAIRDNDSVHYAVQVFLTGTDEDWASVKSAATAKKTTTAAVTGAGGSISPAGGGGPEDRNRAFSTQVNDVGSDDEAEPEPTTGGGGGGVEDVPMDTPTSPNNDGTRKKSSSFSFMAKMADSVNSLKSMVHYRLWTNIIYARITRISRHYIIIMQIHSSHVVTISLLKFFFYI
jgi:hypothetical protein